MPNSSYLAFSVSKRRQTYSYLWQQERKHSEGLGHEHDDYFQGVCLLIEYSCNLDAKHYDSSKTDIRGRGGNI